MAVRSLCDETEFQKMVPRFIVKRVVFTCAHTRAVNNTTAAAATTIEVAVSLASVPRINITRIVFENRTRFFFVLCPSRLYCIISSVTEIIRIATGEPPLPGPV